MKSLSAAVALLILLTQSAPTTSAGVNVPHDDRAITHALNRLAFGAKPGEVDEIKRIGLGTWIERQLHPEKIADNTLDARLDRLTTLNLDSKTLAAEYFAPARQAQRQRKQQQANETGAGEPGMTQPAAPGTPAPRGPNGRPAEEMLKARRVFAELSEAKVLRAVYSERQLEEVLVDFWFNHFNVFGRKGQTEIYVTEYERDVIRPHVLGKFSDLLEATAKSPAMLFYLDNWMSADPDARPERRIRGAEAPRYGRSGSNAARRSDSATDQPQQQQRRQRGINENYARELMELHTLGVDGGYTQQDVVEVARALTGWTIGRPTEPGFRFVSGMHDRGEKRVLGQVIQAGGGIEDGERVLEIVANHPSTAKHIAFKLAQRFVSDTPSQALVDRAAVRFRETKGDLREVVQTIVTSPEFFAPEARQAKVKTPFEFVVSALRAAGAEVSSGEAVARALVTLGMPLYLCQPPTGYDETADTWVTAGALVNRINFAVELAGGRLRGVRVPVESQGELAKVLGSPEFQKQ